ncbi:hypothetical protein ACFLZI_01105 [Nitrospirota bacterium]
MDLKALLKNKTILYSIIVYGFFAIVLIMVGISGGKSLPKEFPAVPFDLEDIYGGERVSYEANKGKPMILYFFASW